MPFTTTKNRPPANARVTVRFSGLLLLKPGPDNTCEIGVHNKSDAASPHTFEAILIVNKPGQPLTTIRLLTGPLTRDFWILAEPVTNGFQAYERDPWPFDRSDDRNVPDDSRWAVDMEALHPGADFNDGARPVVRMNEGVLYTGNLTRENLRPVLGTEESQPVPQHRIAADLAAAIDLAPGGKVLLSWGNGKKLELPRQLDPNGTTYTIVLLNEPPELAGQVHDEFKQYYQVMEINGAPIPDAARFSLGVAGNPNTDEIPCMPVKIKTGG